MGAILASQKGAPEILDPALVYGGESEVINKVQGELMNALDLLQNYQEGRPTLEVEANCVISGANLAPLKLAEKRRNKFEFIRYLSASILLKIQPHLSFHISRHFNRLVEYKILPDSDVAEETRWYQDDNQIAVSIHYLLESIDAFKFIQIL